MIVLVQSHVDAAGIQQCGRGNSGRALRHNGNCLIGLDRVVIATLLLRDLGDAGQSLRLFNSIVRVLSQDRGKQVEQRQAARYDSVGQSRHISLQKASVFRARLVRAQNKKRGNRLKNLGIFWD